MWAAKIWCSKWGPITNKWAAGTEAHQPISLYSCGEGLEPDAQENLESSTWVHHNLVVGAEDFWWVEEGCRWAPRALSWMWCGFFFFSLSILCYILSILIYFFIHTHTYNPRCRDNSDKKRENHDRIYFQCIISEALNLNALSHWRGCIQLSCPQAS